MQADSNGLSGPKPGFVFINKDIYPIVTKPRNNFCIKFYPGAAVFAADGWNLLSASTQPDDYHKAVLYPSAVSQAFRYQAGYIPTDPLTNGPGYWLKFNGKSYAGGPGKPTTTVSIPVAAGWNMIGTVSSPVATSSITQAPPSIVVSSYFGFGSTGYTPTTTLIPGYGYWVKVSAGGKLTLTASANTAKTVAQAENDLSQLNSLTITDHNGRTQTLYLGDEGSAKSLYSVSELPPAAPEFDARFSSGRMVEMYPSKLVEKAKYEYAINITTEAYPVVVSWNISHPTDRKMVLTNGVKMLGVMEGSGAIKIANASTKNVVVKLGGAIAVPKVFALGQNYPNPFNPTTHFTVDVPRASEMEVAIYDVLGQQVATLLTGLVEAGSHELEWDGRDSRGLQVPTGIYFVRMNAASEGFSAVHKIMLMK
ncbi:MAG: T9SS type A sorting domain-containing protein [Ignavibacteriales bacterium]|nr:T9SS type A sorting domain-containing protein [Ignavibacteriales bacterium]